MAVAARQRDPLVAGSRDPAVGLLLAAKSAGDDLCQPFPGRHPLLLGRAVAAPAAARDTIAHRGARHGHRDPVRLCLCGPRRYAQRNTGRSLPGHVCLRYTKYGIIFKDLHDTFNVCAACDG